MLWPIAGDGSSRRCASVKGRGCPRPHRRTFAAAIRASALSKASALCHPWASLAAYAGSWGVGNPSCHIISAANDAAWLDEHSPTRRSERIPLSSPCRCSTTVQVTLGLRASAYALGLEAVGAQPRSWCSGINPSVPSGPPEDGCWQGGAKSRFESDRASHMAAAMAMVMAMAFCIVVVSRCSVGSPTKGSMCQADTSRRRPARLALSCTQTPRRATPSCAFLCRSQPACLRTAHTGQKIP